MSEHHATMSPSAAPAILKCACFQSGPSGDAADRGTALHEYLKALLTGAPGREMVLGQAEDDLAGVEWAADFINEHSPGAKSIEEKVTILGDDFEELSFGTYDCWATPVLYDFKSGEIRDYDAQMAFYSLGMMQRFWLKECTTYLLYGRYKKAVKTLHSYDVAKAVVDAVVKRRAAKDRHPEPCAYCDWCADKLTCPALHATALAVARGYEVPAFEDWHSSNITDPATMGRMLTCARIVADWAESVKEHALKMVLENGLQLPGFELRTRAGTRGVGDLLKAHAQLGMPDNVFLGCCSTTVAKLEKAYKDLNKKTAKLAKAEVEEKLGDNLVPGMIQKFLVVSKEG